MSEGQGRIKINEDSSMIGREYSVEREYSGLANGWNEIGAHKDAVKTFTAPRIRGGGVWSMALRDAVTKTMFDCDSVKTIWVIAKRFVEVASKNDCVIVSLKFC